MDYDKVREAVAAALEQSVPAVDGRLVTGWVIAAELVDSDGERFLIEVSDSNGTSWGAIGMLATVLWKYQHGTSAGFIPEDLEE